MHKIIRNLNLALAGAAFLLGALSFAFAPGERFTSRALIDFVVLTCWLVSAFALTKADRVWPWVGSLLPVALITLSSGRVPLMILTDIWRFQYGDRTVHLDPSTHGMPLMGASIFTLGSLLFLAALLSLPSWRARKDHNAEPCAAPNGGPATPVGNSGATEGPPSVS